MLSATQQDIFSNSNINMSSTENYNFSSTQPPNITDDISWTYREGVGILMIICTLSMIVNTRVLLSVHWIKRPLSATLYISLSLAAADLITSLIVFVNFFLNSYLLKVQHIIVPSCIALIFEAFRLGGIINTVLHLLFLACNHYLGIVRPLHYQSIMTHRKITACLVALWILPPIYILVYFSTYKGQGFQHENCHYKTQNSTLFTELRKCMYAARGVEIDDRREAEISNRPKCGILHFITSFMRKLEFHIMFTLLLVIPFILMTCIYSHILLIVRRQQRSWFRAAERGASCRHRGGSGGTNTQHEVRRRHQHNLDHRRNQQMMRNIKALHTTLLILGSFVAGLLPPIMVYILVCDDCLYMPRREGYWFELFWFVNVLLVTKPLANPIIYAARMHEIKEATRRMRASLCSGEGKCRCCSPVLPLLWLCCGWGAYDSGSGTNTAAHSQRGGHWPRSHAGDDATDSQHLYNSGSWKATPLCRFTNGQTVPTKNDQLNTVL